VLAALSVPAHWLARLTAVVERDALPLVLTTGRGGVVCVTDDAALGECSAARLAAGARLPCRLGQELACRLGLTPAQLRPLLDVLGIRVSRCDWECF